MTAPQHALVLLLTTLFAVASPAKALRGGCDEETPEQDDELEAGRDYGEFCVFPEEGEQESSLEEDSDDSRAGPPLDNFVLQIPGLEEEADSGDEALDALGMVRPGRGKSGAKPESQKRNVKEERDIRFYGVSPEWIYKKGPAAANQELIARRRLRRLAWESLTIPWGASDDELDEAIPDMLARLKTVDPSVDRDDLAAALFKAKQCRIQVSYVKEKGIRIGWDSSTKLSEEEVAAIRAQQAQQTPHV
ncbi:hypothetical protein T484DRAFT_1880660, partial [Baffinella frigidus]